MNVKTANDFSIDEFLSLTEKNMIPVISLIETYLFTDSKYNIEDFMFFRSLKGNAKILLTLHSKAGNDKYPGDKRPDEVIRVSFIKDKENNIIPVYFELKTSRTDFKERELGKELFLHTERMKKELLVSGHIEKTLAIVDCRFNFPLYLLNKNKFYNYMYSFFRRDDQLYMNLKTDNIIKDRSAYKEILSMEIKKPEIENLLFFLDICYHLKECEQYELFYLFEDILFAQLYKAEYHLEALHILLKKDLPKKKIIALLDMAIIN